MTLHATQVECRAVGTDPCAYRNRMVAEQLPDAAVLVFDRDLRRRAPPAGAGPVRPCQRRTRPGARIRLGGERLDPDVETALFRVAQQALANVEQRRG